MSYVIRPYDPADHDAVVALADRLTEGVAPWRDPELVLTAVRGWVIGSATRESNDDAAAFVATLNDQVVGFLSVSTNPHWNGEVDAYVGELVVDRDHQGHGLGRTLVSTAENWAAERGLGRVRLTTGAANSAAIGLYERLGYRLEDVTLTRILPDAT